MPYTQKERLISVNVQDFDDDALLLTGFTGHEAISQLFSFQLDLLSERNPNTSNDSVAMMKGPVNFAQIIGKAATISLRLPKDRMRYFTGRVIRFSQSGADAVFTHYQMEIVPSVWKLTHHAYCRIFHNKTVVEIIQKVLNDRLISNYKLKLSSTYSPIEYCVQYRETDFNFISRLMEQYGIFYYFDHTDTDHTMIISDSSSTHDPCPLQKSAGYGRLPSGDDDEFDLITSWSIEQELSVGMRSLTDYNFKTPSTNLLVSESTVVDVSGNAALEIYDYPGEYTSRSEGTTFAKIRMQEDEAAHMIAHGSSLCRGFAVGYKFNLAEHFRPTMNAEYLLTEIQHVATIAGSYSSAGSHSGSDSYSNHFSCIPCTVPFRPARVTPKPFVQGPQTAKVVGKSGDHDSANDENSGGDGEEIWVDKFGRVMVLFPWDRYDDCSCWIRVSQDWAGQGWGMINIPRVGQEVIVSFLEGNPDRPIITGRVYNFEQTVPYTLPDNGTRTTFKTHSTPKAGDDNYNELRFEDKKGDEQIFVHGEKDYDTRIKNDSREWIGNDRSLIVTNDQTESVGGELQLKVTGNQVEKVGGDFSHHVAGNLNQKTDQTISIQAGQNLYEKSGQNFAHQAGEMIHLKAGMTVVIEAATQLSLVVGGNFIDIGPAGVSIQGTMVMINSGGSPASGCGSSPTSPDSPKKPDEADDGSKGTKMN